MMGIFEGGGIRHRAGEERGCPPDGGREALGEPLPEEARGEYRESRERMVAQKTEVMPQGDNTSMEPISTRRR